MSANPPAAAAGSERADNTRASSAAAGDCDGAAHARARRFNRQHRVADAPERTQNLSRQPAVGHQGVHPRLRRTATFRWQDGRPARTASNVARRQGNLHYRLVAGRPRPGRNDFDCVPRSPGLGCSHDRAECIGVDRHNLPGRKTT